MPPALSTLVRTVASFGERSGALRVLALVDRGDGRDALSIEWRPDGSVLLGGDAGRDSGRAAVADDAAPLPLEPVQAVPPSTIAVDAQAGHVEAPIGAVAQLEAALRGLAAALGGRSVALADFASRDPDRPFLLAAREGERSVLAIGDVSFELPDGGG